MISLSAISAAARVWLYPSERVFTADEQALIFGSLKEFVPAWSSHGKKLQAAADILLNQIIVFAVDTTQMPPSGCSIDTSVALVRRFENQFGLTLLDNGRIFYKQDNRLAVLRLPEIKNAVARQVIRPETPLLNMQAATWGELRENLFIPAARSWMARYFANMQKQ